MADERKPDSKSPAPAPYKDPFVEIVSLMFGLFVIVYLVNGFATAITSSRLFSSGLSGLTPQGIVLNHTRPIASLLNPLGVRVVTLNDTDVYDTPGGDTIGRQKFNSRGRILQGSVTIDGVRYWYVDYDSGSDGWVRENDIAYLESEPNLFEKFLIFLFGVAWYLKIIVIVVSMLAIFASGYLFKKIVELRVIENNLLYPEPKPKEPTINPQWHKVLSHIESANPNDWRLAIIEADIMLDDLLDKLHLPGETMGDKLKAVEKSDFLTIDNAWEAHKIRNQVAHEGEKYILTQREALRVMLLYKSVFEEFQII
jgi:hypothetical protein